MTAYTISILQNAAGGEAGYAHIRLVGVPSAPPDGLSIAILAADRRAGLGRGGWGDRVDAMPVLRQLYRQGTLDLTVGPDVVDHVPAGTPVVLEVPDLSVAVEMAWPDLTGSAVRSRGPSATRPGAAQGPTQGRAKETNRAPAMQPRPPSHAPDAQAGLRARRPAEPARKPPTIGRDQSARSDSAIEGAARGAARAPEARRHNGSSAERQQRGGLALPWKITLINLALMAGLFTLGYAMVFQGVDPIGSLFGSRDTQVAERDLRDTVDPRTAVVLDVLVTTEVGPVEAARAALVAGATPDQAFRFGQDFLDAGATDTALALFELAAQTGHGPAHTAIGRMADPLTFASETSAFSRPNAELAIDWYRRALAAGDTAANDALLTLRLWLEQRAAEGDLDAQNALLLFTDRG